MAKVVYELDPRAGGSVQVSTEKGRLTFSKIFDDKKIARLLEESELLDKYVRVGSLFKRKNGKIVCKEGELSEAAFKALCSGKKVTSPQKPVTKHVPQSITKVAPAKTEPMASEEPVKVVIEKPKEAPKVEEVITEPEAPPQDMLEETEDENSEDENSEDKPKKRRRGRKKKGS